MSPLDGRGRLLALLRERAYERRAVTLASGKSSTFYIDCKQVTLSAEGAYWTGRCLLERIRTLAPEATCVGGLTLGADPLVSAVAVVSHEEGHPLQGFIVRKEPKKHGTGAWIEGMKAIAPGTPAAVLEDVVTTGESARKAAARAREAGLRVNRVFALVDREEGGREALAREGLLLDALFTPRDFS